MIVRVRDDVRTALLELGQPVVEVLQAQSEMLVTARRSRTV